MVVEFLTVALGHLVSIYRRSRHMYQILINDNDKIVFVWRKLGSDVIGQM